MDENGDGVADAVLDSWTYDPAHGVGEAASSQRTVNSVVERSQSYVYDTLSRLAETDTHQQIAAGSYKDYAETLAYDGYYGRPKSIGYPNGEAVATYYSKYGHATTSFNPLDNTVYRQVTAADARGNPTTAILGGASLSDTTGLIQDTRTYRPSTGEPLALVYTKGAAAVRRLDYTSDVYGNLTQQKLNAGATTETYAYDPLMRMTGSARTGAVTASVSYAYDAAGNFTSKSDFSTTVTNAYTYTGATCGGGPNAVKSVKIATGGTRTYCYDADGNLTSDSGSGGERAGTAGPQGCRDDPDLHPRSQPRWARRPQPARPDGLTRGTPASTPIPTEGVGRQPRRLKGERRARRGVRFGVGALFAYGDSRINNHIWLLLAFPWG